MIAQDRGESGEAGPHRSPTSTTLRRAGLTCFVWVLVFIAAHVYWAHGGTYGIGNPDTSIPNDDSLVKRICQILVEAMVVIGTIVPLALYQRWGRRVPHWMLATCCWIGAGILLLRGIAGLVDDGLRDSGLSHLGMTGLTYKQSIGIAHPSGGTLWSLASVDAYFALGGVLFLIAALAYRRSRRGETGVTRADRPRISA